MTKNKIIIFDLGGVILYFSHNTICEKLSILSGLSVKEIYKFIFKEGSEKLYNEGKISSKEFYERVLKFLKIQIPYKEFLAIWTDMFTENSEVSDLIRDLKNRNYKLYLLSNTNELHFTYCQKKFKTLKSFDENILSYEVGESKPGMKIFETVLEKSRLPKKNHIFIDDKEENVEGARKFGFDTILYKSSNELKEKLSELGVKV